jgi:formate hydrogenlyase transcriptional activator
MSQTESGKRGARASDRYRTLLEIGPVMAANLDRDDLFKTIAEGIKNVLPLDRTGVTLHDPGRDNFRIRFLETTAPSPRLTRDTEIPRRGSAVGWVLDHRRYHLRSDLAAERPFFEDPLFYEEGLRCVLNLPLIARGNAFGTLNIASKMPACYSPQDIEFSSLVADQIAVAIDNVRAYEEISQLKHRLDRENLCLRDEIHAQHNFEEMVGTSPAIKDVLDRVAMVAGTDSTVLLLGETGTGKELIARSLHHQSKRKDRALVKVNCAALPAGLIESELFGHEKGAFTGAVSRKVGRFELADGGTLFLDEIGELPLDLQTKLLRVLQEHEFERIGGTQTFRVDVRVIAATNRDLTAAIADKAFRADLYYRLNVFPIRLPSLRDRREDIPILARYFAFRHMIRMGKRIDHIDPRALDRLQGYHWPGNIRELEHLIERAVILSRGPVLHIEDEALPSTRPPDRTEPELDTLESIERSHIVRTLVSTRWVVEGPAGAAKILDLHPSTLRSRMRKLDIRRAHRDIS